MVTPLHKVCGHFTEATLRRTQLEWPQEVVSLFKVLPNTVDFMNQILYADDTMFSQLLFNDGIICDGSTLFVHFTITTLVNQLTHTLQVWVPANKICKKNQLSKCI